MLCDGGVTAPGPGSIWMEVPLPLASSSCPSLPPPKPSRLDACMSEATEGRGPRPGALRNCQSWAVSLGSRPAAACGSGRDWVWLWLWLCAGATFACFRDGDRDAGPAKRGTGRVVRTDDAESAEAPYMDGVARSAGPAAVVPGIGRAGDVCMRRPLVEVAGVVVVVPLGGARWLLSPGSRGGGEGD